MAEIKQAKQVEASPAVQRKPSQEAMPTTLWLKVADLQVDYSYQHRPYAKAIEELRRDYQQRHNGFILVSQRENSTLWVLDGQTRCAVQEQLGIQWIKAEMLYGLTQAQEAEVYLLKCINANRMPVDFFHAEFVAGRPVAVLIHKILEKRGIEIESYASTQRTRGVDSKPVVTCVSYLKRMIAREEKARKEKNDTGNPIGEVLGMALDLIHDTWEYGRGSLTALFLDTLHRLLLAHDAELDRKTFIAKLSGHLPESLRERALQARMATDPRVTTGAALQRVMIDLYNSGRRDDRRIILGSPNRS